MCKPLAGDADTLELAQGVKPQEEKDLSLPAQKDAIQEYATRRGLDLTQIFEDVESAKEPGRTHFTEMMEALRRDPRIDGVICHKMDRLSRNLADLAMIHEYLNAGIDFQFISGNFDRSPAGMLSLNLQGILAQHYILNLSEEVKKGLHRRVLHQGRWAFPALWATEQQFAAQLAAIQLAKQDYAALRAALQESFQHEQAYRKTKLTVLRRRHDEIEKKRDVLTERYLEDRIAEDQHKRKYELYRQGAVLHWCGDRGAGERPRAVCRRDRTATEVGNQMGRIYENSDPARRRALVKLVSLNVTLKGGNARLNLFPPFEVLRKVDSRSKWWAVLDLNQ